MAFLLKHKLAVVLLVALGLRLGAMIVLAPSFDFMRPENSIHGSEAYDTYAQNLLATGVYGMEAGVPDAKIPPLFSYLVAAVYGLFGRGYVQIALLNTGLDLLSILLLYAIAQRLFTEGEVLGQPLGGWVGALAGLFFAGYPYLVFQTLTVIDTPFWITIFHLFVLLMILLRDQAQWGRTLFLIIFLSGITLGFSLLLRPIMPFFAVFAALWFLFRLNLWQSVARLLPVALIGAVVIVPWIVRNAGIFDAFVPMTTTSGANLWQGNSQWTVPVFQAGYDVQWTAPDAIDEDELGPYEADQRRYQEVITYWRENTAQLPDLFATKFLVHWDPRITPLYNPQFGEEWQLDADNRLQIVASDGSITGVTGANVSYSSGSLLDTLGRPVHLIYFGGLLGLALVGFVLSLPLWRDASLLWFVQISMTIVYMIFHPSTRYRAPSDPLLFMLSAYALVLAARWFLTLRRKTVA